MRKHMRRPNEIARSSERVRAAPTPVAVASRPLGRLAALARRAQQWLSARERLIARWLARFPAHMAPEHRQRTPGGAGAIVLPFWWEYESELKCRLALEALLRRLFSIIPAPA